MSNYKAVEEDFSVLPSDLKIAFVISEFNGEYTQKQFQFNREYINNKWFFGIDTFKVPWAFEIPGLVRKIADTSEYDLIIALWVIVKWDTYHFETVANESARWLMSISIDYETPIINWILTCYDFEQVEDRLDINFALSWLKLLKECKNFI